MTNGFNSFPPTHRGFYTTADLGVAESYFGGNKNFLRLLARSSYNKPLFHEWVFAVNTQAVARLPGWIDPRLGARRRSHRMRLQLTELQGTAQVIL